MTASSYGGPSSGTTDDSPSGSGLDEKKEQAQQVAGTAKDEGGQVAAVAKEEALNVADEAKQQAANLLDQALSEVEQQSAAQRDRLVDTLRTFSDDVEKMLSGEGGGDGLAADLARQVAERARGITQSLQGRQPGRSSRTSGDSPGADPPPFWWARWLPGLSWAAWAAGRRTAALWVPARPALLVGPRAKTSRRSRRACQLAAPRPVSRPAA